MIKYWVKIVKQEDSSLVKKTYLLLKADADSNITYRGNNWAFQIKKFLSELGFLYVWQNQNQNENDIPLSAIKQRILDNYLQKWYADINNSSRLQSYCIFKHSFDREKYLSVISDYKLRNTLSRFRMSSHNLYIETGRYYNIPREQRLCKSCNMSMVENEYHFLMVCPHFKDLRNKYFKRYYCQWPTLNKFRALMSTNSTKDLLNLAKFVYFANKKRIV